MGKYCKDVQLFHKVESCNTKKFVYRETTSVDDFHFLQGVSSDDGKKVTFVMDPIYEAFNVSRLKQLGRMNVESWFDSLKQKPVSSLQALRDKCSDEQLVSMMKSRYLQSPSDILAWSEYMSSHVDQFNKELIDIQSKQSSVDKDSSDDIIDNSNT